MPNRRHPKAFGLALRGAREQRGYAPQAGCCSVADPTWTVRAAAASRSLVRPRSISTPRQASSGPSHVVRRRSMQRGRGPHAEQLFAIPLAKLCAWCPWPLLGKSGLPLCQPLLGQSVRNAFALSKTWQAEDLSHSHVLLVTCPINRRCGTPPRYRPPLSETAARNVLMSEGLPVRLQ